jgi:hypothetical protein
MRTFIILVLFILGLNCNNQVKKNTLHFKNTIESKIDSTKIYDTTTSLDKIYWTNLPDKNAYRNFPTYNVDSLTKVKIIHGSFTKKQANELLVFKSIRGIKEQAVVPILLIEKKDKYLNIENFFYCGKFKIVDCNSDDIKEIAINFDDIGNGTVFGEFSIISLLNNSIDTLFYSGEYYDKLGDGFSRNKGDTAVYYKNYSFFKMPKCDSLFLKEQIEVKTVKTYNINTDKTTFKESKSTNLYKLQKMKYVKY